MVSSFDSDVVKMFALLSVALKVNDLYQNFVSVYTI